MRPDGVQAGVEPSSLMLFDIDGTLLVTSGAGMRAMSEAGRDLFGETLDVTSVDYSGGLDPVIIAEILAAHGRPTDPGAVEIFRAAYLRRFTAMLGEGGAEARALPGVHDLLDVLVERGATLGLLTGNYPETGELKLRAARIDPDRFHVRVWGCDSPHAPPLREHLPAVAFQRHLHVRGSAADPTRTVVIGDTPHDVRCARAGGCRVLGVGTGRFTTRELLDAGADHASDDLSDVEAISDWLLGGA